MAEALALPEGGDGERAFNQPAAAILFGYPDSEAVARVRARSRSWRAAGAAQRLGLALLVTPFVALLPPHAPWAVGALALGVILARRRWIETHTLDEVDGACPSCGAAFSVTPARLRQPHPLPCESCHHVSMLRLREEGCRGCP